MIATDGPASHLSGVDRLANTFSIMRHGQSKANVAGIIVSCIENDLRGDYGLSELGRAQALEAAQACGLSSGTVIFSSDFSRARQTAEIVRARLDAPGKSDAELLVCSVRASAPGRDARRPRFLLPHRAGSRSPCGG